MDTSLLNNLKNHANNMRKLCLEMAFNCGTNSHLGGGLSIVDVIATLYGSIMNVTDSSLSYEEKDKFILSKGHGVLGLYSGLAEFGIINQELLSSFLEDGSDLIAHPVMKPEIGLEASSGSLGQGISLAVGLALAAKKKGYSYNTFVICGNGECNEGSVWEACMFAASNHLDNLTIFIDNNEMQSDGNSGKVLDVSNKYTDMFLALGFNTIEIDGNDIEQIYDAYNSPVENEMPKVIVGKTIKGKGISFMENNNDYHHNRLTKEQYYKAMEEIGNG